jgi:hypothetical protein
MAHNRPRCLQPRRTLAWLPFVRLGAAIACYPSSQQPDWPRLDLSSPILCFPTFWNGRLGKTEDVDWRKVIDHVFIHISATTGLRYLTGRWIACQKEHREGNEIFVCSLQHLKDASTVPHPKTCDVFPFFFSETLFSLLIVENGLGLLGIWTSNIWNEQKYIEVAPLHVTKACRALKL